MYSIDNYRNHFLNKKFDYKYTHSNKSIKNKLSNNFDKLFFNFLNIINYNIPYNYNKHIETTIKYDISKTLENAKLKKKETIVNNLSIENEINLFTLFELSNVYNINLIYFNESIYHLSINDENNNKFYMVNSDKDIYHVKYEKIEKIIETCLEIKNIYKPFYSLSHYKLEELKKYIDILKINLSTDKKYKKIDYYNIFVNHINCLLL
jgi:hypothetical protein